MSTDWEALTRESYDRVAEPYARLTRPAVTENTVMAGDYSALAALAVGSHGPGTTVVDVGCGPGWWARHLCGQGVRVLGVDLSPGMLALAGAAVPPARFVVGSVLALPLAPGSAGGLACMYVLHHVPDDALDRAVGELARVLAPGGALLLGGHVGDSCSVKREGYGGLPMEVQVNRRPAPAWEDVVRHAGLELRTHRVDDADGPAPSHALLAVKARS